MQAPRSRVNFILILQNGWQRLPLVAHNTAIPALEHVDVGVEAQFLRCQLLLLLVVEAL